MSTVQEIESAIEELSALDKTELCAWFQEHLAQSFDMDIEQGIDSGVFDRLVEDALVDHKAGRTRLLPGA